MPDVVVVGAGHNGLVAAARLARAGRSVTVYEAAEVVGGACRTEFPFERAPEVACSTGAYLLGLMPPELLADLQITLPLRRRDPHYLLPARRGRSALLLGADEDANAAALSDVFGAQDAAAHARTGRLLAELREDLGPSWLAPALPLAETAERYVRPALRKRYLDLVRGSALEFLSGNGFRADELIAMYAATDGMPGSALAPDEPGTGHNLLVHSMCRLPASKGTWMAVKGGMGTVSAALADAVAAAGGQVVTGKLVTAITATQGAVDGVAFADGSTARARAVVAAVDPHRLAGLASLPELAPRLEAWRTLPGMTFKLNLALDRPPEFGVPLPGPGTTVHLLAAADGSYVGGLLDAYAQARSGRLPSTVPLEVYVSAGLATGVFVQPVPNQIERGWAAGRDEVTETVLARVAAAAPGLSVRDRLALSPPDIESRFGITTGHIFHVDNSVATVDRMPCRTELAGLYAGGAGTHPAGSVIGAAGWIAAGQVLHDLV